MINLRRWMEISMISAFRKTANKFTRFTRSFKPSARTVSCTFTNLTFVICALSPHVDRYIRKNISSRKSMVAGS
ncbi:hypothetical protein EJ08DRAFT_334549 [Tothia fuscella]|uniref:Uncharacterized protein n=1 Tax=Tothia fuscella TaxID=1048955 RepID=A0A9P4P2A3_9PEZI|nr:hypothetical protein EJ08DRAFT_334549 [Tothia fuscella]